MRTFVASIFIHRAHLAIHQMMYAETDGAIGLSDGRPIRAL